MASKVMVAATSAMASWDSLWSMMWLPHACRQNLKCGEMWCCGDGDMVMRRCSDGDGVRCSDGVMWRCSDGDVLRCSDMCVLTHACRQLQTRQGFQLKTGRSALRLQRVIPMEAQEVARKMVATWACRGDSNPQIRKNSNLVHHLTHRTL
eukprot:scaffold25740_cov19-Tisochrysis_lutea.AAC.1